MKKNKID